MATTSRDAPRIPIGERKSSLRMISPSDPSLHNTAITSPVPRRVPIPRHVSSPTAPSQLSYQSFFDEDDDENTWWKTVVREQIDVQTLRDMARFFRTTEPPSFTQRASIETQRDCFGAAINLENKRRWSLQSLRRASRKSRRISNDSLSSQFKLPDNAVPSTTQSGHEYVAISVPTAAGDLHASVKASPQSADATGNQVAWPRRLESLSSNGSGPSTPTSASFKGRTLSQSKNESTGKKDPNRYSANGVDDRSSLTADPSLRFYGAMLRLLGPSPVEEDEAVHPPPAPVSEPEKPQKSVQPSSRPQTAQSSAPTAGDQPEVRSPPLRSPPSYSTIPKVSRSPRASLRKLQTPHSRAGSSATTASKLSAHAREKSSSQTGSKTPPSDVPSRSPPQQKHTQTPPSPPKSKVNSPVIAQTTMLHVPLQSASVVPGSPGFPAMLAAMSFPSPPETSPPGTSHGGAFFGNVMPHSPAPSSGPETPTAPAPKESLEAPEPAEPAGAAARDSIASVTTVRSDLTATTTDATSNATTTTIDPKDYEQFSGNPYKHQSARSRSSLSILDRKRSQWSLVNERAPSPVPADDAAEREKKMSRLSRSSFASASSTSTNTAASQAASALAERRAARRQKVKEKIQRDLTVSTTPKVNAKNSNAKALAGLTANARPDAVDSPVLGYFPQNTTSMPPARGPRNRVKPTRGSSVHRLAPLPDSSDESPENGDREGAVTPKAMRTVTENRESSDDNRTRLEQTKPSDTSPSHELCISPIMVAASIEPYASLDIAHSPEEEGQVTAPGNDSGAGPLNDPPTEQSGETQVLAEKVSLHRRSEVPTLAFGVDGTKWSPAPMAVTRRRSLPSVSTHSPLATKSGDEPTSAIVASGSLISSRDEQQWLRDHQRQSVQDWRQAAVRERERIQQLAAEERKEARNAADIRARKSPVPFKLAATRAEAARRESLLLRRRTTGGFDSIWSSAKFGPDAIIEEENESTGQSHVRSTSLTTRKRPVSFRPSKRSEDGTDSDGDPRTASSEDHSVMEQRVLQLERARNEWADVMVPLLENMNRLLVEISQGNMGGMSNERSAFLRDSMHMIRSAGAGFSAQAGLRPGELANLVEEREAGARDNYSRQA